jgi:hypothetical protein
MTDEQHEESEDRICFHCGEPIMPDEGLICYECLCRVDDDRGEVFFGKRADNAAAMRDYWAGPKGFPPMIPATECEYCSAPHNMPHLEDCPNDPLWATRQLFKNNFGQPR